MQDLDINIVETESKFVDVDERNVPPHWLSRARVTEDVSVLVITELPLSESKTWITLVEIEVNDEPIISMAITNYSKNKEEEFQRSSVQITESVNQLFELMEQMKGISFGVLETIYTSSSFINLIFEAQENLIDHFLNMVKQLESKSDRTNLENFYIESKKKVTHHKNHISKLRDIVANSNDSVFSSF